MKKYFKPILTFIFVAMYRVLPFRPPNVEPILASVMPLSKKYGIASGVIFSVASIILHDSLTAGIGAYTWSAAFTYALVSLGAGAYFVNKKTSIANLLTVSSVGIVFYDVMTGIILGPLATGGNVFVAFIGQIPFTALHLMGGAVFALTLSPILAKWFEMEKAPALNLQPQTLE